MQKRTYEKPAIEIQYWYAESIMIDEVITETTSAGDNDVDFGDDFDWEFD